MTIEIAPPVATVKAAPAAETAAPKEKAGASDKPLAGDPAGFMAILASLESDGPAPVDLSAGNAAVSTEGVLVPDACTGLAPAVPGAVPPQDAATALLSQALQWTIPADMASVDTRGGDGGSPVVGAAGPAPVPLASAIVPKLESLQKGAGVLRPDSGLEAVPKANMAGSQRKGFKEQLDTAALQSLPGTGATAMVLDAKPSESRDVRFVQADMVAKMAPSVVESVAAVPFTLAKREEQHAVHGVFQSNSVQDVTGVAGSGGWLGGAVGTPTMTTSNGAAPTTQSYIAEQVSFWISNDIQKAEMKLDGLGDKPVEVSISMNGNQAHVAFRTDEVQARDALENASLQLKEMLQKDGVVLSGMSVGTSAGGESGAGGPHDRNTRQGRKNVVAMVDQPARVEGAMRGKSGVGRALDLFV